MMRLSLLLLLGFALSTALSGCLAGPGVEPPRASADTEDEKTQVDSGQSPITPDQLTPGAGASGSQTGGGSGAPAAIGGAGGAGTNVMDAAVADGGAGDTGIARDAEIDDDAGSEQ